MYAKALLNRLLPPASFARNVGVLAGGTAFGQAITVLALPVLTRLYTPADFSALAVYAAMLGILSVIACMRLEIAIPLPKEDGTAINLLVLGLIFSTAIAATTGVVLFLFSASIASLLNQPGLNPHLWMLPLGVWLAGIYSAFQFWSTRKKRFSAIGQTRMTQALGSTAVQLSLGMLGKFGPFGLLLGQMLAAAIGLLKLARPAWSEMRTTAPAKNRENLRQTLAKYSSFPKYSALEALTNAAATQIPIAIIGAAAIGPEAGFLLLAMRACGAPSSLIGNAIAQVYLSRASDELRAGRLAYFTMQIITRLIWLGVGPLIAIGIVAPSLMPLIFGREWARAGIIISWITPWFVMKFLSSPLAMSLQVTDNKHLALINQIIGFAIMVIPTALAAKYLVEHLVAIYALCGLAFNLGYFLIVLRLSKIRITEVARASRKGLLAVVVWCLVGVIAKYVLDALMARPLAGN